MEGRINTNYDTGDLPPQWEWIKGISGALMPFV